MSKTKLLLMNAVSLMTIVSLVTGCCPCLGPEWQPEITIDMGEGEEVSSPVPTSEPQATVAPMATPGAPSAAPVEIVSQTEMSPDEFLQSVQGDGEFADVYGLASEQGYSESETAGEFTMSDGTVLGVLVLSSPAGERVLALRFQGGDRAGSLLARVEAETLVLYNREGRSEITAPDGTIEVDVFDAAGNPIGENAFPVAARPAGSASAPQQQGCTGGLWDDYDHCCRGYIASGYGTTAGCASAFVALIGGLAMGGWGAAVGAAAFLGVCPFALYCLAMGAVDDYPTWEARLPLRLDTPCASQCGFVAGTPAELSFPNYRIEIAVDDDRPPRPASPQYVEVCAGEEKSLEIQDCYGHTKTVTVSAPQAAEEDIVARPCAQGQDCVAGRCVGTGDVRVTLTWRSTADMDLHVIDPSGEEIYYDHDTSASGGQLDVDDRCEGGVQGGPENIFWPTGGAPRGQYEVRVVYYEECAREGATSWTVVTMVDGQETTYTGNISPDESQSVCTFSR